MDKSSRGVQCLERAMDILEAVGAAGELGVTEISERVDLHVATVHNILRTLANRHYLTNSGGRYRLGPAMAALSSRWDVVQSLPSEVQPYLDRLSERTGEAASATILVGSSAKLIAFRAGTQAITIHYPQWDWPNPLQLATGRLLVAFQPTTDWVPLLKQHGHAQPYWTPDQWTAELQKYRDTGSCILHRHTGDQTAMGFPVYGVGGRVLAAIGVSAPSFRADEAHCAHMLKELQAAAGELSTQLGWDGASQTQSDQ